ncbi:MAG: 7-cyano-7-deazaguanine synthase QueC [Nitrospirae bacterium]|nr:MAG: 7-cyano-7-deazaguanine synthase QueC [Nitrospirota bacterium]
MQKAVVLLSGGIDSATTLMIAKYDGFSVYALTVNYGQRHLKELEAAEKVAKHADVEEHLVIRVELDKIGGSALTSNIEVPKMKCRRDEIPITYVPARNTVLLSLALSWAEVVGADCIFIGANAIDYSGYPDCRQEFLEAFERMANLATKASIEEHRHIKIIAPLLYLTKAEIIKRGTELGVDYSLTWSCYDPTPEGLPCGHCDSCCFREKGFKEAGIKDPLVAS